MVSYLLSVVIITESLLSSRQDIYSTCVCSFEFVPSIELGTPDFLNLHDGILQLVKHMHTQVCVGLTFINILETNNSSHL